MYLQLIQFLNFCSFRIIPYFVQTVCSQIAPFPRISDRSSSGLVEWGTKDEAVTALALCNHQAIPNTEGRYPFLLKLSFSSSPVNDRAFSGSKKIGSSNIGKSAASVDSSEYEQLMDRLVSTCLNFLKSMVFYPFLFVCCVIYLTAFPVYIIQV